MDKRSWPWRKKPSDKGLTSNVSGESSPLQSLKHFDDQVMSGLRLDNIRISDATMLQHQADENIRHLNERLLAADDLVKQHVKVAEEAVSGWEKAKAEYVSVKHQLDTVVEQKRATEDRVFHLDGALKECMQQLRQTREEQEQKLHEVIIRKARDWEKLRLEFEERLAHANQQLVEAGHQKNHLYKTVQEQAEVVAELGQARSQAEAEVQMLQVRVETFEKENASLKYEVTILNKELEIRNQEKEINKRSADLASRQHLEGIKKITKLEAECQRLRGLVRKKLPGPGALVQMKLEVEGLDAEKGEFGNKWRSGGKAVSSPKAAHAESMLKSESILSEHLQTMEEETKMLKEALAKRNSELQMARLMCARTADRLSTLEGQVGHFQKSPRIPLIGHGPHAAEASISLSVSKEPSQASMSEDGNDDERSVADSWASALVTELAYFQKEKATQQQSNKVQQSHKVLEQLNSIDDFIEIERLVSLPLEKQGAELNTKAEPSPPSISEQVLAKEAELQAANKLCADVNKKLVAAEAQLSLLRSKNAANELNLFSLQQKLSMILEGNERGDPEKLLEDVKNAVLASRCSSVDGLQAHVMKLSKVSSPGHSSDTPASLETSPHQESSPSKCGVGDKIFKIGPEITSGVCKLVRLVKQLASEGMRQHLAATCPKECPHNGVDSDGGCCNIHSTSKSRPLELDTSIRNFITTSNQFLHGKVELVQFIADLSSVLSQMRKLDSPAVFSSLASRVKQRPEALLDSEQEVLSDAGSPVSRTSNSDGSEQLAAKVLPADGRDLNSRGLYTDEDLRKVQAEKAALESHMRAEFSRMATVEQMFAQLKQEKIELENTMEEEKEKLETMKGQLLDAEQLVASLGVRLASTELSRNLADERLSSLTAVKAKLESQLEDSQLELTQMHEKLKSFKKSIDLEHARNEELQTKVDELQKILWKPSLSSLQSGATLDAEKSIKEQEIVDATEKLAECQRTILVLGKQLKDIASARDPPLISFNSPDDQIQKPSQKDEPAKNANINSTLQKDKQRVSSDLGDCSISDVTEHEIISAVKGSGGRGLGMKMSDILGDKLLAHEGNIQAVSHMRSSPDAEADTQLANYVPKPAVKKKSSHPFASVDLSKSLNLDPSSSPRKHGTSFSRFFSRQKNAS